MTHYCSRLLLTIQAHNMTNNITPCFFSLLKNVKFYFIRDFKIYVDFLIARFCIIAAYEHKLPNQSDFFITHHY